MRSKRASIQYAMDEPVSLDHDDIGLTMELLVDTQNTGMDSLNIIPAWLIFSDVVDVQVWRRLEVA